MPGREKWSCEKCKTGRFRRLQEDLQNAIRQTDDLKTRKRKLKEKLLLVGAGRKDPVPAKQAPVKCTVIVDSMVRDVWADHTNIREECFPGTRAELLYKVIEKEKWAVQKLLLFTMEPMISEHR
jgi:hypothetical protein